MTLRSIFALDTRLKNLIEGVWDSLAIVIGVLFANWLVIGWADWHFAKTDWLVVLLNLVFAMSLLMFLGHYTQMIRYMGSKAVYIATISVGLSSVYLYAANWALQTSMPVAVPVIYFGMTVLLVMAPRMLIRGSAQAQDYRVREKCIIFGATETGRSLALALKESHEMFPVAFVDDKRALQGKMILGMEVFPRSDIPKLAKKYGVSKVLLAVNNTSLARRRELIAELEPYAIELQTVPTIHDIVTEKRRIDELQEINIEELLGRDPVPPISSLLEVNIKNKHIMVTGAGGSIGSELCRQIVKSKPKMLVLFELSEYNLYQIDNELRRQFPDLEIVPILASIQDAEILREVIQQYKIQTIYHAAAYKHVPMVECNILAGIRNNVFGTANVALVAAEFEVEKFVLVSTDKAVRPTNVMGATKRFAELFIQGLAELHSNTQFAIVRFGNVLGSSGSVVPLFKQQIRKGGPVTVTHPDIIRYFMTIPEAAQLVIQAGAMGTKGEVFVLDMGEPVKIVDLAHKMAHLMGHSLSTKEGDDGDIELVYTGLRPGEKLYEELLIDDAETDTEHPRIMGANEAKLEFSEVVMLLDELNQAVFARDEDRIRKMLLEAPLSYAPASYAA